MTITVRARQIKAANSAAVPDILPRGGVLEPAHTLRFWADLARAASPMLPSGAQRPELSCRGQGGHIQCCFIVIRARLQVCAAPLKILVSLVQSV